MNELCHLTMVIISLNSLIIGTGCWVQVFSLILDSSVGLWVGIQSAGD